MIGAVLTRVVFVDDDPMLRAANAQTLALADLSPEPHDGAASALAAVSEDFPGVVVTDVRMPGMDGLTLFRRLRARDPDLPVIIVTGHGDVPMAVAALKDGAWDFLVKPYAPDQLVASVRRALTARGLVLENRALRAAALRADDDGPLIGAAPAMVALRREMRRVAAAGVDVLVEGETGTGKELVAMLLHRWGARPGRPFVAFDCAGTPAAAARAELFGYQNGVVPGLRPSLVGRIEAADGGTLFLDSLGAMPADIQGSMLRVLEEREVTPLGADQSRHLNLRVIVSLAEPPATLVARGDLRADLGYRLGEIRLRVPPLRERREDIPVLFAHFCAAAAQRHRAAPVEIDRATRDRLLNHDWPGNVRELAHFAERLALRLGPAASYDGGFSLPERTQRFEADAIRAALRANEGNIQATILALGIPRKTFYDKVAKYNVVPRDFRSQG